MNFIHLTIFECWPARRNSNFSSLRKRFNNFPGRLEAGKSCLLQKQTHSDLRLHRTRIRSDERREIFKILGENRQTARTGIFSRDSSACLWVQQVRNNKKEPIHRFSINTRVFFSRPDLWTSNHEHFIFHPTPCTLWEMDNRESWEAGPSKSSCNFFSHPHLPIFPIIRKCN